MSAAHSPACSGQRRHRAVWAVELALRVAIVPLVIQSLLGASLSVAADAHIRDQPYSSDDVVSLAVWLHHALQIELIAGDRVVSAVCGDPEHWTVIAPVNGRRVYVSMRAGAKDSNLIVNTEHRVYTFALSAARRPSDALFRLRVTPNALDPLGAWEPLDAAVIGPERRPRVRGYRMAIGAHSEEIAPVAASDDGHFVTLYFAADRPLPAIYERRDDDTEALLNLYGDGYRVVIHQPLERMVLRRDRQVVSLYREEQ